MVAVRPAHCQIPDPQTVSNKFTRSVDVSLGIAAQLTRTRTPTDIRQVPTGEFSSQTTQGNEVVYSDQPAHREFGVHLRRGGNEKVAQPGVVLCLKS